MDRLPAAAAVRKSLAPSTRATWIGVRNPDAAAFRKSGLGQPWWEPEIRTRLLSLVPSNLGEVPSSSPATCVIWHSQLGAAAPLVAFDVVLQLARGDLQQGRHS